MARTFPAVIHFAWLCALCLTAFCEESATPAPPTTFFVIDYLPPAIYEADTLAACFRIENTSTSKKTFQVTATAVDSTGSEIKKQIEKTSVAAGTFSSVKFECDSKRVARIAFELKSDDDPKTLEAETVLILRDDDAWPETKIENGRLKSADGRGIVIPVVEKKRAVEVREFAPMKWIFGSSKDTSIAHAGTCAAFAPAAWQLKIDAAKPLGPWPLNGSIPILNAMNQIVSDIAKSPPGTFKRVVILLTPEDLDLATDPRTYRVVLDALLARLVKVQIGRIALIAPFKYGGNDTHRKAIWREIHESANVNAAMVLDPLDWMHDAQWRADPTGPNIFATHPNAAGRKMIEQAIADLIR